jgi:hypothetical protein
MSSALSPERALAAASATPAELAAQPDLARDAAEYWRAKLVERLQVSVEDLAVEGVRLAYDRLREALAYC